MTPQTLPLNPRSIKLRFSYRFLQALKKLNNHTPVSSSSRDNYQRYHRIKFSAYASMASAVGSRRAWSRTLLWKIRTRALNRSLAKRIRFKTCTLRRRVGRGNPRKEFGFGKAEQLRKLVPGGKVMDIYSLLDETAHYIQCLNTQVQAMRNIVDLFSS